jgi:hypothetical protein
VFVSERWCENPDCGALLYPELGDGPALCRGCQREAVRARELGQKDSGAPVIAWAAVVTVVVAAAGWAVWYFWHAAAVID